MLETLKTSKTSIQTLFLFLSQIFSLVIGFVANLLLAKRWALIILGYIHLFLP